MAPSLLLYPESQNDIADAYSWYRAISEELGDAFIGQLDLVFQQLVEFPLSCSEVHEDKRRALLRRFPYQVIYRVEGDSIFIIAVFHVRRNPSRWKSPR